MVTTNFPSLALKIESHNVLMELISNSSSAGAQSDEQPNRITFLAHVVISFCKTFFFALNLLELIEWFVDEPICQNVLGQKLLER